MTNSEPYSIRIIANSLEKTHQQVANSRQRLLEKGLYSEYLILAEFTQTLNVALIELVRVLASRE